jgi:ketosteroid isomerase-like protein
VDGAADLPVTWSSSVLAVAGADAPDAVEAAVLAANDAFYAAFEARSLEAMDAVWSHEPTVVCTHPGWRTLVGWPAVRDSWAGLLANDEHLQFIVTGVRTIVTEAMALVSATENLLAGGGPQGSVEVLNVFARGSDGRWRMVAHHGSPVLVAR